MSSRSLPANLALFQRVAALPAGKRIFSRGLCFKAPYFSSIRPLVSELQPGLCEVRMKKRRAVTNHIGTVHAIAMCNMAELSGGLVTDVTIPTTHRWIPKCMTVEYLRKAESDLVAVARPEGVADPNQGAEYPVTVEVRNTAGELVFRARITMWVSPKKNGQ